MKSVIVKKDKIDWDHKIIISDLYIDPEILESHKQRVNSIFKNLPQEQRDQQVHNIVVRDNILNKAMDYLSSCYQIEFNNEDIEEIKNKLLTDENVKNKFKDQMDEIAKKVIIKTLIYNDIQNEYNISVSDEELLQILNNYYKDTNLPIREFMDNKEKFQNAKNSLLDEKITHFIIDRFPRDLSELEKKLYASLQEKQDAEKNKQQN